MTFQGNKEGGEKHLGGNQEIRKSGNQEGGSTSMEVTKTILVPPVWVVAQVGKLVLLERSCAKKGVYTVH